MAQKLTLTEYLRRRGAIKALTRIEAEAFGIPWPLQSGWPAKFAGMEITAEMLADLQARMASAKQSTVKKARHGLAGASGDVLAVGADSCDIQPRPNSKLVFPGFARRIAKRYRATKLGTR